MPGKATELLNGALPTIEEAHSHVFMDGRGCVAPEKSTLQNKGGAMTSPDQNEDCRSINLASATATVTQQLLLMNLIKNRLCDVCLDFKYKESYLHCISESFLLAIIVISVTISDVDVNNDETGARKGRLAL